jgi:hypothetical protein
LGESVIRFVQKWKLRRHLKKHERERKDLEARILELDQIKRLAQEELKDLEYHEKLWNSVQLDK